jgi:hypothetical protein
MKGALAVGGAAIAVFVTNQILSTLGAKVDAKNKKWLMVASALGLGLLINKLSFTKKYATELTIGAVSYGLIAALSTNTDIKKYFAMAGTESDELDQIISNLNVAGEINFLGAREVGGEDSELNLLGISEMLGNMEQNDYSEDYE